MIGTTFQFEWEVKLIVWLQTNLSSLTLFILDKAFYLGDTVFIVCLLAFFYFCYDKKAAKTVLYNAILSLLCVGLVKNVFQRRRPYFDNPEIKCLRVVEKEYDMFDIRKQGFSFPSMHTSNIVTITVSFYRYYKKKILLFISIFMSMLVGVSRFVFGCHYPTDVLAGLFIGLVASILFSYMQEKLDDKYLYLFGLLLIVIGCTYCTSTDFYSTMGIYLGFIISDYIDKKYIKFENSKNIKRCILRLLLGLGLFLAITEGIKLFFPQELLAQDNAISFTIRVIRYFLGTLVGFGLTPMLYKYNILKVNE